MARNKLLCQTLPGLLCCLLQGLVIGVLLIAFYYPAMPLPGSYWACLVIVGLLSVLVALKVSYEQRFVYLAVLLVSLLAVTFMGLHFLFISEKMQSLTWLQVTLISSICFNGIFWSAAGFGFYVIPRYRINENWGNKYRSNLQQSQEQIQVSRSNSTISSVHLTLPGIGESPSSIPIFSQNDNLNLKCDAEVSGLHQMDNVTSFENEQRHLTTPDRCSQTMMFPTISREAKPLNRPKSGLEGAPTCEMSETNGPQSMTSAGLPLPSYTEVCEDEEPPPSYDIATSCLVRIT